MRTVTVRDLRNNFAKVETWLGEGEEIRIEKRGKAVGYLVTQSPEKTKIPRRDWKARRAAIWGDRCFTVEEVRAMREAELEGEEG